jgi:hypothetical protein
VDLFRRKLPIHFKSLAHKRIPGQVLAVALGPAFIFVLGFTAGRDSFESPSPVKSSPPDRIVEASEEGLYSADEVEGHDFDGLPRYPDSRLVEYRQTIGEEIIETEVEYVVVADFTDVHHFYREVFDREGWSVADLGIYQGEWTFFVVHGTREALVEIETRATLVEIEIELSEPIVD